MYHVSPRLQVSDGQGTSSGRGTVLCGGQGPSAVPETELTQVCACAQPQAISRELVHRVHVSVRPMPRFRKGKCVRDEDSREPAGTWSQSLSQASATGETPPKLGSGGGRR